jgi:hypothetical protein
MSMTDNILDGTKLDILVLTEAFFLVMHLVGGYVTRRHAVASLAVIWPNDECKKSSLLELELI